MIDQWFKNEASVQRALDRDASGLRAAIGTNPELQAYTVRRAEEPAGRLILLCHSADGFNRAALCFR